MRRNNELDASTYFRDADRGSKLSHYERTPGYLEMEGVTYSKWQWLWDKYRDEVPAEAKAQYADLAVRAVAQVSMGDRIGTVLYNVAAFIKKAGLESNGFPIDYVRYNVELYLWSCVERLSQWKEYGASDSRWSGAREFKTSDPSKKGIYSRGNNKEVRIAGYRNRGKGEGEVEPPKSDEEL